MTSTARAMASGLWAGAGLGSEDTQILTQINLGLHRCLYKRAVNFPCGARKRYRWEGPWRGAAGRRLIGKGNFCFRFDKEKKNSPKEQNGLYFKLISQLRLLSKNDCSLGRNVVLNKEMEAETGTHPTSGRGSSGWPDLRGPKPLGGGGQRQLRKPGRSGQPG